MRESAPPLPPLQNTGTCNGAVELALRLGRACALTSNKTFSLTQYSSFRLLGLLLKPSGGKTGSSVHDSGALSAACR